MHTRDLTRKKNIQRQKKKEEKSEGQKRTGEGVGEAVLAADDEGAWEVVHFLKLHDPTPLVPHTERCVRTGDGFVSTGDGAVSTGDGAVSTEKGAVSTADGIVSTADGIVSTADGVGR
eukprot:1606617-Rhodomonas_salina.3